ncbi:MAG: hypothetical protein JWN78_2466 [Bacteroidota bacterium]|nr:hypothetical protein [Bacteroidota bacterium]
MKKILLPLILLLNTIGIAQTNTYISTYNYRDINTNGFIYNATNAPYVTTNDERYMLTSMQLASELKKLEWDNTSKNTSYTFFNYKLFKTSYTTFPDTCNKINWTMIMVRPNDSIVRPLVIISNGAGAWPNGWIRYYYTGAMDLVQRGYAVAIINNFTRADIALQSSCFKGFLKSKYPNFDLNCDIDNDNTQCYSILSSYLSLQTSIAAAKYLSFYTTSRGYLINSSQIFFQGHSNGAMLAYNFAFADFGVNYTGTLMNQLGNFDNLTYNECKTQTYTVRGITMLSGESQELQTAHNCNIPTPPLACTLSPSVFTLGNFVESGENNIRLFMVNAKYDNTNIIDYNSSKQTRVNLQANGNYVKMFALCGPSNHNMYAMSCFDINNNNDVTAVDLNIAPKIVPATNLNGTTLLSSLEWNEFIHNLFPYTITLCDDYIVYKAWSREVQEIAGNAALRYYNQILNILPADNTISVQSFDINGNLITCAEAPKINNPDINSAPDEKILLKGFNIYPNPTRNEFTVEANNMESNYNITVYNMIGEVVYNQNNVTKENQLVKVNTNTLANGIYKVIIENKESKINKSIVVQH